MCSDTQASYGSLARYKTIPRIAFVGSHTLVGASGEYSDFQEMVRLLRQKQTEDFIQHDNVSLGAAQYAHYLAAIMYDKRNRMNPFFNTALVAGFEGESPYLAYIDMYGTLVKGNYHATSFGMHMGKPILVNEWREDLTEAQAKQILEKVMRVGWYRDCRASNRIQFAKVTRAGVEIEEPYVLASEWNLEGLRTYPLNPLAY
jgi:20S proteasome subunit beta 7